MTNPKDLTTAEGVLEWGRKGQQTIGDFSGAVYPADTKTADYIAGAVRLRMEFERQQEHDLTAKLLLNPLWRFADLASALKGEGETK